MLYLIVFIFHILCFSLIQIEDQNEKNTITEGIMNPYVEDTRIQYLGIHHLGRPHSLRKLRVQLKINNIISIHIHIIKLKHTN